MGKITIIVPQKGTEEAIDWDKIWWVNTKEHGAQMITLRNIIGNLITQAHIAGSESTKGLGMNVSKEERAEEYCKEQGFIT